MSTIKVNKIENTATASGGIAIDASGHVQIDGQQLPSAGALSHRNLVVNGAMQVAQRATQVTGVTGGGYLTCDRMNLLLSGLGTWTVDQSTDAPTGFSNSWKLTCTTADATPASGDYCAATTRIEAQNLQHLNYGSSDAVPITMSFYVKSNKTGAASLELFQEDPSTDRMFPQSYTINSANTWEYKTITFTGDTSGLINNDNGIGFYVSFWMNSGSVYTGGATSTTWIDFDVTRRNPSNLGVGGAVSDYFAITGIQLEVGEKATPFEHRSYGDELARCQRYYQELYPRYMAGQFLITDEVACQFVPFYAVMRSTPTATYAGISIKENNGSFASTTLTSNAQLTENGLNVVLTRTGAAASDSFVGFITSAKMDSEL